MKISAWHKAQGDYVEWYQPLFSGHMDKVYMSKVFTFTPDYEYFVDADEVLTGGTGYRDYSSLPSQIDGMIPDYSIYPQYDYAIGFLTRGCIRSCKWCVVPKKEGKLRDYDTWQHIKRPDSKKLVFMDNNVLASDHGLSQIEEMTKADVRIDFNQGLDARLVTDEVAKMLAKIKWDKYLRMACDTSAMLPIITEKVRKLGEYGLKPYKIFSYVLIEDTEDAYKRIVELDKLGINPFAQPYRDFETNYVDPEHKRLARWCNMVATRRTVDFKDYR